MRNLRFNDSRVTRLAPVSSVSLHDEISGVVGAITNDQQPFLTFHNEASGTSQVVEQSETRLSTWIRTVFATAVEAIIGFLIRSLLSLLHSCIPYSMY